MVYSLSRHGYAGVMLCLKLPKWFKILNQLFHVEHFMFATELKNSTQKLSRI
ncbi:MAG: hypothetical protein LBI95_00020 [Holosporales bacterium]|nr:hypothetical protein [Holosporales bacterium]